MAAPLVDIDAIVAARPFKHRKGLFHHVELQQLSLVLIKNGLLQGVRILAADAQPAVPLDDAKELARFAWEHLKWPVAKDLLISSVARLYERAFIAYYAGDDLRACRAVRGAQQLSLHSILQLTFMCTTHLLGAPRYTLADVADDARVAYELVPRPVNGSRRLIDDLRARVAVARMVLDRAPYPVAVANAAILTVEEGWLIASFAYRRHRVARAHEVLAARSSTPEKVHQAHRDLVEYEEQSSLFYETLDLTVRTGSAVISETFGAALGTLVWPGFGTSLMGLVCGALCWVV